MFVCALLFLDIFVLSTCSFATVCFDEKERICRPSLSIQIRGAWTFSGLATVAGFKRFLSSFSFLILFSISSFLLPAPRISFKANVPWFRNTLAAIVASMFWFIFRDNLTLKFFE